LEPYQSLILVFGAPEGKLTPGVDASGERKVLDGAWGFSIARAEEYPYFHDARVLEKLENIGNLHPDFSGFMRYEKAFELEAEHQVALDIENAFDGVEVWVNGEHCGMKICPPYRFDLSNCVRAGTNTLRIEVANTLDREVRASAGENQAAMFFMGFSPLSPSGILGAVTLYIQNKR